jgi:hypothetical protein
MSVDLKEVARVTTLKHGLSYTTWMDEFADIAVARAKALVAKTSKSPQQAESRAKEYRRDTINHLSGDDWAQYANIAAERYGQRITNLGDFVLGSDLIMLPSPSSSPVIPPYFEVTESSSTTSEKQKASEKTPESTIEFVSKRTKEMEDSKVRVLAKWSKEAEGVFAKMTDDERKRLEDALKYLVEINGSDAYSNEALAVGSLQVDEYLALPQGMIMPEFAANEVGDQANQGKFSISLLAQVYALNKKRAPQGSDPIRYGMLRLEAVKMGWWNSQKETVTVAQEPDAIKTFITDLGTAKSFLTTCKTAAFLLPLASEHVFRVFGHHYLDSESATYEAKYEQVLKGCLATAVTSYLPKATLYHHALHWVSPRRVYEVLQAQITTDRIPESIKTKFSAAPAGTAIITTTDAVLKSMQAAAMYDRLKAASKLDLDAIRNMTATIKANPVKYHKVPHAYGLPPLSATEQAEVERIRTIAAQIAPVTQGYIDAMFHEAPLGKARALKKHSDENPTQKKRSARYFKNVAKNESHNIEGLFVSDLEVVASVGTAVTTVAPTLRNP